MTHDGGRCSKRDKPTPLPPSLTIEKARHSPRYRSYLEPGAQCELPAGHDGAHRNGCLLWHDPPLLIVAGKPYEPPTGDWMLLGELVPGTDPSAASSAPVAL